MRAGYDRFFYCFYWNHCYSSNKKPVDIACFVFAFRIKNTLIHKCKTFNNATGVGY